MASIERHYKMLLLLVLYIVFGCGKNNVFIECHCETKHQLCCSSDSFSGFLTLNFFKWQTYYSWKCEKDRWCFWRQSYYVGPPVGSHQTVLSNKYCSGKILWFAGAVREKHGWQFQKHSSKATFSRVFISTLDTRKMNSGCFYSKPVIRTC